MPPPLPESVRHALRIFWNISHWCNYQCDYCGVPVFSRRTGEQRQLHAFDHHTVAEWLEAFGKFPQREIHLSITGGEPFLDRAGFLPLLEGLASMPRFTTQVYTNASWNPDYFAGLDKQRLHLAVSYHPSQTLLEPFLARLRRMRELGFYVAKVNLTLAPENVDTAEESIGSIQDNGIPVSVNPMIPAGMYLENRRRSEHVVSLIERYALPTNAYFQVLQPVTRGRLCYHPGFAYHLEYDGAIAVSCIGRPVNLFADPLPELPGTAVPCPFEHCYGCGDMVRSLVDEPILRKPVSVFYATEFVQELREYREAQQQDPEVFRKTLESVIMPGTGRDAWSLFQERAHRWEPPGGSAKTVDVPLAWLRRSVPKQPVLGSIDCFERGNAIATRAADRIAFSGWAVSTRRDVPLREVRLRAADHEIGVFREFYPRPEVVARFHRSDFLESGWRGQCFVPNLRPGDYPLAATATAADGAAGELPPLVLRITG